MPATDFYQTASPRERRLALAGGAVLGALLAMGFLPTAKSLGMALSLSEGAAFAGLAMLFHLSLPSRRSTPTLQKRRALLSIPLPLAISALYGVFHPSPPLWRLWETPEGKQAILWFALYIPVGEELLFRGWAYSVAERLRPHRFLTDTNPLPLSVWASAIAFSLWHGQNLRLEPWALVLFQMAYTLLTGLWLGYIRWRTGSILVCIIGHIGLNLAANLW